jgi:hypothetical protein
MSCVDPQTLRGAKSGAVASDPDLTRIIDAWPSLPEPIRRAMLALLSSTVSTPENA